MLQLDGTSVVPSTDREPAPADGSSRLLRFFVGLR